MLASLDRLAALPGATRVCCTHEYIAVESCDLPGRGAGQRGPEPLRTRLSPCENATSRPCHPRSPWMADQSFSSSREASVRSAVQAWRSTLMTRSLCSLAPMENEFR